MALNLAQMFAPTSPIVQWAANNQNFLSALGTGLMQGQNLQHGLQLAGQAIPQADALDLQQAEKRKADKLVEAQKNATLTWLKEKHPDIAMAVEQGILKPGEGWMEAYKRDNEKPDIPAAPSGYTWANPNYTELTAIKGGPADKPGEKWVDLTDAQEAALGYDPTKQTMQRNQTGELKVVGGGGVNVTNTVNPGENEYAKIFRGGLGKQRLDILNAAATAPSRLATLSLMEQALNQDNFYSGVGADQARILQGFAKNMGLSDASGISSMETFNAAAKQLTRDKLGSLGAGVSNADVQFLTEIFPNLGATKEGNMVMIEVQKRIAKRELEIDKLATAYAAQHGGMIDEGFIAEMARYNNENPVFADIFVPTNALAAKQAEGTYRPGDIVQDPNDPTKRWKFKSGDWRDRSNWTLLPQGGN